MSTPSSNPSPGDLEALELSLAEPHWREAYAKLKPYEQQFLDQLLIHGHPSRAGVAAGFSRKWGIWALEAKPYLRAVWDQMRLDRMRRVEITADHVLVALWEQYNRLLDMLAADWNDVRNDDGSLKPMSEWPEIWRTAMVNGIDVESMFERSTDGEQAGERKSWDQAGTVTKIRRESRLGIEKQIAETQKLIAMHVNVNAFVQQKAGDTNILVVTAETARRVTSARARLAKVVDVGAEVAGDSAE